jgi:predicted dehydrogenase
MVQNPLQIAIVGAGLMGRWHACYAARAGAQVAAIVDTTPHAAEALRRRHPAAAVFTSLQAALDAKPIDAVHICTALPSHAELAEIALRSAKPVLLEKPVARSLQETRQLLELAAAHHVPLVPVHQFPFQRGFQRLLRQRHQLGQPVRLEYRTASAGGEGKTPPQRQAVLLEILPHPLSLFRALLGDNLAEADWRRLTFTDDDLLLAGRQGNVDLSILISLRARPTCNEFTFIGDRATARADLFHGFAVLDQGKVSRSAKMLRPLRLSGKTLAAAAANLAARAVHREPAYPGLRELILRFYNSIRHEAPPPVAPAEILDVAAFLERILPPPPVLRGRAGEGAGFDR